MVRCSCGGQTRVLKTEPIIGGTERQRRCLECGDRMTTTERVENRRAGHPSIFDTRNHAA